MTTLTSTTDEYLFQTLCNLITTYVKGGFGLLFFGLLPVDFKSDIGDNSCMLSKEKSMKTVERFNDWSVRQYDGAEMTIDGKFYHGMITELSEEGIQFLPYQVDYEYKHNDPRNSYDRFWVHMENFDKYNLEIWDEHRGGDDSSIGLSGYFTQWRHVWPDEFMAVKEMTYAHLKSLEPKQMEINFG